mgnify:CR=1 FL=1
MLTKSNLKKAVNTQLKKSIFLTNDEARVHTVHSLQSFSVLKVIGVCHNLSEFSGTEVLQKRKLAQRLHMPVG